MRNLLPALLLFFSASAQAQGVLDRVGPLKEIYESYNDCFAATKAGRLNPEALVALGWSKGQYEGGKKDVPLIFARGDRAPLLMVSGSGADGICVVMARFEDVESIQKFLGAWGSGLPKFKDGQLSFFAEGHPIIFRQAGSQDKPRLNLIVGIGPEAK